MSGETMPCPYCFHKDTKCVREEVLREELARKDEVIRRFVNVAINSIAYADACAEADGQEGEFILCDQHFKDLKAALAFAQREKEKP